MRLVIIVTIDDSDLWTRTSAWTIDEGFTAAVVRVVGVGNEKVSILRQATSEEWSEDEAMLDIRRSTTPWLIELANSEPYRNADVYVACHAGYVDLGQLRGRISDARYRAGAEFSHQSGDPLFDSLIILFDRPETESFEAVIEGIIQRQELTYAQRLSTLKHRLAHVFLPVIVDLHAWRECGYDDLYMQELLDSYQSNNDRLDRARSLLYEESSGGDNIEKLIRETDLEDDDAWTTIKFVLPPKSVEAQIQTNNKHNYESFLKAKSVLDSLQSRDRLLALRTQLRTEDTFGGWCRALDKHLAQLVARVD